MTPIGIITNDTKMDSVFFIEYCYRTCGFQSNANIKSTTNIFHKNPPTQLNFNCEAEKVATSAHPFSISMAFVFHWQHQHFAQFERVAEALYSAPYTHWYHSTSMLGHITCPVDLLSLHCAFTTLLAPLAATNSSRLIVLVSTHIHKSIGFIRFFIGFMV